MDIIVLHPAFQQQRLRIRTSGLLRGPTVHMNDMPVKRVKGRYTVINDAGEEMEIQLKSNVIDPVPVLKMGDETVRLARALRWYEYLWIGVPIILLFIGGGLGAGIGIVSAFSSSRIFRSDRSTPSKYLLTGLISVCAFITFIGLVIIIQTMVHILKP